MRVRVLLFVLGAVALFTPFRVNASVVSICNQGDASLNATTAVYSKSIWLGDSYHVTGWYAIEPGKCAVVYSAEDPEDVYFGFTFLGSDQSLRKYVSTPSGGQDNLFKAISENFCVAVGQVFDYKTKTKGVAGGCQAGFQPLEFSLYAGLDSDDYGRVGYTLFPHKDERESDVIGTRPGTTARLIFGDPVQFDGSQWTYANGTALPHNLVNQKTGLPPLLPKEQYSPSQEPVAQFFKQIKHVMNSFQQCRDTGRGINLVSSQFDMDDHGIADFTSSDSMGTNPSYGAAIANVDLNNPHINDHDPGCLLVSFDCKTGGQCVRQGNDAMAWLSFWVNTREQANTIIEALKGIAVFYPDGQGEMHSK
ncbi:MAG TPA: hypothetical protein VHV80_00945 [Steroidobacteraceae bacterium]|jgi:hypothetical protein|nr:hypothetical protein [Steroidobacteraceae bacterium]